MQQKNVWNIKNSYLAGLFDADGTITINVWNRNKELNNIRGNYGKAQRLIYSKAHNQWSYNKMHK